MSSRCACSNCCSQDRRPSASSAANAGPMHAPSTTAAATADSSLPVFPGTCFMSASVMAFAGIARLCPGWRAGSTNSGWRGGADRGSGSDRLRACSGLIGATWFPPVARLRVRSACPGGGVEIQRREAGRALQARGRGRFDRGTRAAHSWAGFHGEDDVMEFLGEIARKWWLLVLFGVVSIVFGCMALFAPMSTVVAMAWAIGVMAIVEGLSSVIALFGKDSAGSRWLLVLYALVS